MPPGAQDGARTTTTGLSITHVVANDAASAERALEVTFPSIRLRRVAPAGMRARVSSVAAASFSILDYVLEGDAGGVSSTDDFTAIHTVGRDYTLGHGRHEIASVKAFLAPSNGLRAHWSSVAAVAISLDSAELGRIARTAAGRDDLRLRRTGYDPVSPATLAHWNAVVADLRRALAAAPEMFDEPLIERSAFEQLATAFLHAFPTNWLEEPDVPGPGTEASSIVRRALEFIYAASAEPITVADIAGAAGVSTRGLHAAFTRELDETPLSALRRSRLEGAHADLLRGEPGATVQAIARRWGFGHPARFSARYRRAYGELPSETLQR